MPLLEAFALVIVAVALGCALGEAVIRFINKRSK